MKWSNALSIIKSFFMTIAVILIFVGVISGAVWIYQNFGSGGVMITLISSFAFLGLWGYVHVTMNE